VRAAREALETGNVEGVLPWLGEAAERQAGEALTRARLARGQSPEARDVADRYFVDTIARFYCIAVDEVFMGVAPPGEDLGPAFPLVDRAVRRGELQPVLDMLHRAIDRSVRARWKDVALTKKRYTPGNTEAGRRYAAAYAVFADYVAAIFEVTAWEPPFELAGPEEVY
jgi:hypothetical protein